MHSPIEGIVVANPRGDRYVDLLNRRAQDLTSLRRQHVARIEAYLRDSSLMTWGFLIVVSGWALQVAGEFANNIRFTGALLDAGAVFQFAGTISIIVGLSILAIGFFRFARRVESHISSHT